MSVDFTLASPAPPDRAAAVAQLPWSDVQLEVSHTDPSGWDFRAWRPGRSTRSVRVGFVPKSGVELRLASFSTTSDLELGIALIKALANVVGAREVDVDVAGAVPLTELDATFGAEWIEGEAQNGPQIVRRLIADGRGPIEIPGVNRSFFMGTRMVAALEAAGPAEDYAARALAAMLRVQWLDPRYADHGLWQVGQGDRQLACVVWRGEAMYVPAVDVVVLFAGPKDFVPIRVAELAELVGPHFAFLDERQALLEAVAPADFATVVERARPRAIELPKG